jgi:hypothetical protein
MSDKPKEPAIGFTITAAGKPLGTRHSLSAAKYGVQRHRRENTDCMGPYRITGPRGEEWTSVLKPVKNPSPGRSKHVVEWKEKAAR